MEESFDVANQLIGLGYLIVFLFLTTYFASIKGYFKLPFDVELKGKKLPLRQLLTPFVIYLGFSLFVIPLFMLTLIFFLGKGRFTEDIIQWIVPLTVLVISLVLGGYFYNESAAIKKLILGKKFSENSLNDFGIGVLTWFLAVPFILVTRSLITLFFDLFHLEVSLEQVAIKEMRSAMEYPTRFLATALSVVFIVPIIEEFLFRGCLQTWIKGRLGMTKAIVLTSIIFAFFHFSISQGLGNVELLASLFVLSCFLGFIYERQQSLLASIFLHMFFNGVTVLLLSMSYFYEGINV